MTRYQLSQLSHEALLHEWDQILSRDNIHLSELLLVLGEVDARKLFRPAGYPSMFLYCVEAKHMSEDVAIKRIRAARIGRRYPTVLQEVAKGRLHLTGIFLISKHLTDGNAQELFAAAIQKSRREIELLLATRFPQPDLPTFLVPAVAPTEQIRPTPPVPGQVESMQAESDVETALPAASVEIPHARVTPLAPERFGFQTTISQRVRDKLSRVQELLGHRIAPSDLESLLECVLDIALPELEKRKLGATERPQKQRRPNRNPRHIPAAVKREVRERDGDRCAFVSDSGHRCQERSGLEFDHVLPVGRGGKATVANTRLLCRAHNQFEAEKIFGVEFMNGKRERSLMGVGGHSRATA